MGLLVLTLLIWMSWVPYLTSKLDNPGQKTLSSCLSYHILVLPHFDDYHLKYHKFSYLNLLLAFFTKKNILKKWRIPRLNNCIFMYIKNCKLMYKKTICTTIVCISNKYTINSFRPNLNLFRFWHSYFSQTSSHFQIFVRGFVTLP